jgi:hypothetical protein
MFAIIAAVLFGIALILDLARISLGDVITGAVLLEAGLLCLALHLAGVGATTNTKSWRPRRRRRA